MIKSGETQEALVNLVKKSKAEVSGIFSLIAVGEEWKKRLKSGEDSPVEVVTHLKRFRHICLRLSTPFPFLTN
jgi:adenine phosphoribosyltransferase